MTDKFDPKAIALWLADLYSKPFGGKPSGRFRLPAKLVARKAGKRRLYEEERQAIARALYEEG